MTMGSAVDAALSQAPRLLDFGQKLDVQLLDAVVDAMNSLVGEKQQQAQKVLMQLMEHEDSWQRVDAILEFSSSLNTKYFALQILDQVIKTRWRSLPRVQCDGIKSFIVGLVIKISSDSSRAESESVYLQKLNLVLVQIVKQEWPNKWPTFISDIVGASKTNESLCMNNMRILKLLSEEVFDFSADQLTQAKAHHLKTQFCGEFQAVFQLCQFVFENSSNVQLVGATLETLLKFLNWIPVGYIFETDVIDNLTNKFLPVEMFRNVTLKCLYEIAGVNVQHDNSAHAKKLVYMFMSTLTQLKGMVPAETDMRASYGRGSDDEQKFINNLALFLCTFLREHFGLVEVTARPDALADDERALYEAHCLAITYLLKISEVDDVELFKVCLDYWNWLTAELYRECPFLCAPTFDTAFARGPVGDNLPPRRRLYHSPMTILRYVIIGRMSKPEEVLVVENDQGEVVRETIKDTDSINLYKTMRETLVYLTHLDYHDTERIMTEKLQNQVNGTEWSWKNLNTLCWAVGSISGAMMEEDEKRFLVTVIRDLLGLCEQKRGKDNKAVIASNIMYVVGQYPRFLRAHWKFLKTVVNKLFEFMHETHEGVQDMACDTFIKIAHKCRRHFVCVQVGETQPFIDEILANLQAIICDLTPPQVHVFYEAVGHMIAAVPESDRLALPADALSTGRRDALLAKLMSMPNSVWDEIISAASNPVNGVEVLKEQEAVRNLANILKTNVAACKSIGDPFLSQLGRIYMDMLNVYKVTSENVSQAVATHGDAVLKQQLVKSMRGLKTDMLRLLATWIEHADDANLVLINFVPPLFDAVLFDYQRNVAGAREPEVLACLTVIVNRLQGLMSGEVPRVFDAVFGCTLEMISRDLHDFPEHRANFFRLLQAVNEHCFDAFLRIPPDQFKLVVDAVVWAMKHSMRNVMEIGLEILLRLLRQVSTNASVSSEAAQSFYQNFFVDILEHVLAVVTDASLVKLAGLTYYADILCVLFDLVESGKIAVPLNMQNPQQSNMDYIYEFVGLKLKHHFPHLTEDQIRVTVKGFYSFDNDVMKLRDHLRDFLVQIKTFAGEDTADLFLEERETEIQQAQEKKHAIPGMLNPHAVDEGVMVEFAAIPPLPTV